MTQKYYLSTFSIIVMVFVVGMILLSTVLLLLMKEFLAVDIPGIIPLTAIDMVIMAVIIWRMRTPVVEISETGLKVGVPFLFKTNFAKWDEIEAIVIDELSTFGIKESNIKILLKGEDASTKEIIFGLRAVEKADEIIEKLKERIPEKRYEDIKQAKALQIPITKTEIRYKDWMLTGAGIHKRKEMIPWENVKEIKYQGFVIAGYGATTITYSGSGGRIQRITAQPSTTVLYQDFIRYLIQHSQKAAVDPGLLRALEYSQKDAKADIMSILLFFFGIFLLVISISFLNYYSPTVAAGNMYPLLAVFFGLVPMGMIIKLLVGRFRGKIEPASKKMLWSLLACFGPVASLLVFFALSPFSFYWFVGDIFKKTGDIDKAESYYLEALESFPDSIDIPYEMGKIYRERKEYEKAFEYLKQAYTKDPSYWGPKAVELLPDTLLKMKKYDEAITWCEQILKDHPKKIDIKATINRKKDEIIAEKGIYERSLNNQTSE